MIQHPGGEPQSQAPITLLFTGDLVLDVPDAEHWLSGIAPAIARADLAIGHLEVPHTRRGLELKGDVPAPGAPPENLDAVAHAGFAAVTLAGNHIADCGADGIADTVERLRALGVGCTGAGATLDEARRPVVLTARGRCVALLSYNCVGPEVAWASSTRAGCNYLRMRTADGSPVTPPAPIESVHPEALQRLTEDIAAVRGEAGLVVVALHKGIVHTPARLAPYERPLARAAVEAGADVVIGHHAHILRGIEFVHGRPVFHGLGNGCVVTRALSPDQDHPARAEWARRRRELFGFEPDPAYTLAPFHPEAVNALLGVVRWHADGRLETGGIPAFVEPPGRPVLVEGERASSVLGYVERITRDAGLPPLSWRAADGLWLCD